MGNLAWPDTAPKEEEGGPHPARRQRCTSLSRRSHPHPNLAREIEWVNAAKEAVAKNLLLLYPYLEHDSSIVRQGIAQALSLYPEHAQGALPLLEKALSVESNEYTREAIQEAITKLQGELSSQ
jgi:HEAT repeat protein